MRTSDEIRALLAEKFTKEKKRLKTYGTKANSFDLANAVSRYVQSMMAESRHEELYKLRKFISKKDIEIGKRLRAYILERESATNKMARAIGNVATESEGKRPWKASYESRYKGEEPKKHRHKHKHKHRKKHGRS